MKKKRKTHDDFVCDGIKTLSNHGGLEIQLSDDGDAARLRYYGVAKRWQVIKYNCKGDPYVTYRGTMHKLKDFFKTKRHG